MGETSERHYRVRAFFRAACLSKARGFCWCCGVTHSNFRWSPRRKEESIALSVTAHQRNGNQRTVSQKGPNKSRTESCLSSLLAPASARLVSLRCPVSCFWPVLTPELMEACDGHVISLCHSWRFIPETQNKRALSTAFRVSISQPGPVWWCPAAVGWGEASRWRRGKARWQWAWKPFKWVRKSLGLDGEADNEKRDIMKTKDDPLTGSEVRHSHGSPVIAFTASSRESSCKRNSRNGWQMRQWLAKNLRHNNVYFAHSD